MRFSKGDGKGKNMAATTKRKSSVVNFAGAIEDSLVKKHEEPHSIKEETVNRMPVMEKEEKVEPTKETPVVNTEQEIVKEEKNAVIAGTNKGGRPRRDKRPLVKVCYTIKESNAEYLKMSSRIYGKSISEMVDYIVEKFRESDEGHITKEKALAMLGGLFD